MKYKTYDSSFYIIQLYYGILRLISIVYFILIHLALSYLIETINDFEENIYHLKKEKRVDVQIFSLVCICIYSTLQGMQNRRTNLLYLIKSLYIHITSILRPIIYAFLPFFCIDLFLLYHLCQKGYQHTTLHKRGISYYWTFPETIPIVCSTSIFQRIIGEQVKPILWQSDNICCILINTMCVTSFESTNAYVLCLIYWIT